MNRPSRLIAAFILVSCAFAAVAPRAALAVLQEEPKLYRGIRSEGMGGLLYTTGNYGEALFGNPARLSEVDVAKFTIIETQLEGNTNIFGDESALSNVKASSGGNVISTAGPLIGRPEFAALQIMTAYYNPTFIGDLGFGFGLLAKASTAILVEYTTDIDTQTFVDIGPNFGFSYPLLDHQLSVGLNMHFNYRVSAMGTIDSLSFLTGSKLTLQNFGHQGFGFDADLGAYYHIPWDLPFMRLNAALTFTGLTKTHYNDVSAALMAGVGPDPVNDDRLVNFGLRADFPDYWWFYAPIFAVEFQQIGDTVVRSSFAKKTHIGTEAHLSRVFSLRLGLNQGYAAAGLGVDLPVIKFDLSTYGEELTGNAGVLEDRRIAFKMAFEL